MAKTQAGFPVPQWQLDQLDQMAADQQLDGVDPSILAAIDVAESHGNPGTPNAQGAGGYFGVTGFPGEGTNSTQQFDAEAQAAAQIFATQQGTFNDNYLAEAAYQQGPAWVQGQQAKGASTTTEGVTVFKQLGIPEDPTQPGPNLLSSGTLSAGAQGAANQNAPVASAGIWGMFTGPDILGVHPLPYLAMLVGALVVVWGLSITFKTGGVAKLETDAKTGAKAAAVAA